MYNHSREVHKGKDMLQLNQETVIYIKYCYIYNNFPQATDLIKQLAEANKYQIDSATTENTIKLYQLLRAMPYEGFETMWKQFAANEEHRSVLYLTVFGKNKSLAKFQWYQVYFLK